MAGTGPVIVSPPPNQPVTVEWIGPSGQQIPVSLATPLPVVGITGAAVLSGGPTGPAGATGLIGPPGASPLALVTVTNQGANPISVYPHATGVINEQAASTPITVQPNTTGIFASTGSLTASVTPATGLTATGTNQGTALSLTALMNIVSTAVAGTGVVLPTSSTDVWVSIP